MHCDTPTDIRDFNLCFSYAFIRQLEMSSTGLGQRSVKMGSLEQPRRAKSSLLFMEEQ